MMSSKHLRGDANYAWPTAEVAVMGAKVNKCRLTRTVCSSHRCSLAQRLLTERKTSDALLKRFAQCHAVCGGGKEGISALYGLNTCGLYLPRVLCRSFSEEKRQTQRQNTWINLQTRFRQP